MNPQQVLGLFVDRGVLTPSAAEELLAEVGQNGKGLVQTLTDFGVVATEDEFYDILAGHVGADRVSLADYEVPPEVRRLVRAGDARLHGALPVALGNGDTLLVALLDPLNAEAVENLRFVLDRDVQQVVAPVHEVQEKLDLYYGAADFSDLDDVLRQFGHVGDEASQGQDDVSPPPDAGELDLEAEAGAAPIVRFVDLVLHQAVRDGASDIHFEPFEHEFKIRYRVDGALYEMSPPPRHLALPVISRVKVMANLNIAERRLPQDGRIQTEIANRGVDLRVSTLPTQHGESVVLRVLDRSSIHLDLAALGMPPAVDERVRRTIAKPSGIFIVTGPTGSGKTTTLYACLREVNTVESKLLTAEDPVEYDIEGLVQVPVNDAIGLTFARLLRAFLRQDPDRIMVGEVRDLETAQIAVQASLTGHLVFSTLHTNDAAGAVTRLVDMGVEPFLISSSLEAVLAQRLVRRICPHCRTPYQPGEAVLASLGLAPSEVGDRPFHYGRGCERCHHTGYRGRQGIYELLDVSDPIRELINERAPGLIIRQQAIALGMVTLREDGLRSIYEGDTTVEEVLKHT